jgi:hypothetical protein
MTASELSSVVSYNFAVVQPARGQAGTGLTLHLLLDSDAAGESTAFLQLEKRHVWAVRDTCAGVITAHPDKYASFVAKTQASHQLNYGDKFLKTLPSSDSYANFHRRRHELPIPPDFLTRMHTARTGVLSTVAHTRGGLVFRFAMRSSEPMVFFLADDLVFMMVDTIDQAVWAAEWERDDLRDEAGS